MAPRHRQRRLRAEACEERLALASDLGQIAGVVSDDLDNDGTPDAAAVGLTVELLDGDRNALNRTATTDDSGAYAFERLGAGDYFVRFGGTETRQAAVSALVSISELEAAGTTGFAIDDFTVPSSSSSEQSVEAFGPDGFSGGSPDGSADFGNSGVGGSRDLAVEAFSGFGRLVIEVNAFGSGQLDFSSDAGVTGTGVIVWDGLDFDPFAIDTGGLALDLSSEAALFSLSATADRSGDPLRLRVYSSPDRFSEVAFTIEDTDGFLNGDAAESIEIPFDSFLGLGSGGPADFSAISAIELEIDASESGGLDAVIDSFGVLNFTTKTADLTLAPVPVVLPAILEGVVYSDLNRDGLREGTFEVSAGAEILIVLDQSGSMSVPFGDGSDTSRLQAAIEGVLAFNQRLIEAGLGEAVSIGVVVFNSASGVLDLDPVTPGTQTLVRPNADANADGVPDLNAALAEVLATGNTSFVPALQTALETLASGSPGTASQSVLFLSDGQPNDTEDLAGAIAEVRAAGVSIQAYGIGSGASLESLRVLDPTATILESASDLIATFDTLPRLSGIGDPGLGDWVVYLDDNRNGVRDLDERFTRTDENGAYAFEDLEAGAYAARVELQPGWEGIVPVEGEWVIELSSGGLVSGLNFGVALEPVAPIIDPGPVPTPTPEPVGEPPPVAAPTPQTILLIPPSTPVARIARSVEFGSAARVDQTTERFTTREPVQADAPAYRYGRGIDEVDYDLIFESLIDFQRPDLLPLGLGDEAPEEASDGSSESDTPAAKPTLPFSSAEANEPAGVSDLGWSAYGREDAVTAERSSGWLGQRLGLLVAALVGFSTPRSYARVRGLLLGRTRR